MDSGYGAGVTRSANSLGNKCLWHCDRHNACDSWLPMSSALVLLMRSLTYRDFHETSNDSRWSAPSAWGSIIAGVILSMIVYLIMSVLGMAIGASLLSPMSKPDPLHGFGFGPGVWVIVTTVLAVFVGSYYAGRSHQYSADFAGILSWAVMTLLVVYGMTSMITGAVSTAGSVGGNRPAQVSATAANQSGTTPSIVDTAKQQVQAAVASAASAASQGLGRTDGARNGGCRRTRRGQGELVLVCRAHRGRHHRDRLGGRRVSASAAIRRKRWYGNWRRYAAGARPRGAGGRSSLRARLSDSGCQFRQCQGAANA